MTTAKKGLLERLAEGPVICAEGYLFELERRGYLQAGAYVPEVVLENPHAVEGLHREFLRAGSDIMEAFTYYAHREKLRLIGREDDLEPMNRAALRIAKKVADEGGAILAGNICNTNIYDPADAANHAEIRAIFEEQVQWAVEEGAEMLIGETFSWYEEAEIALDVMMATGLPTVVTLAIHREPSLRDGMPPVEACKRLADKGADVVGLNCIRGPWTMIPVLAEIARATDAHVAGLPVPYRTTDDAKTFHALCDHEHGDLNPDGRAFPVALDPFQCTRYEMAEFARQAADAGVSYLGVCCGAGPHHIRAIAEVLGRRPPASAYSPDMSKHYAFGSDQKLSKVNTDYAAEI